VADGQPRHAAPPDEEQRIRTVISRMGLDEGAPCAPLSAGLKRRVSLARALAGDPDILLLDEPTNHLDIDAILWMEEFLLRFVKTMLFVTHDRAFLRRLATRILEIDRAGWSPFPATTEATSAARRSSSRSKRRRTPGSTNW